MRKQEDFERGALGHLLKNTHLFRAYEGRLRPDFFSLTPHKTIYTLLKDAVKNGGRAPTLVEVEKLVHLHGTQSGWPENQVAKTLEILENVFATDSSWVTGDLLRQEFITRERDLLCDQIRKGDNDQFIGGLGGLKSRLDAVRGDQGIGGKPLSLLSRRTRFGGFSAAVDMVDDMYNVSPVATGFPLLDRCLMGGLRPQEVTAIMAFINVGKSMVALNIAVNMLRAGKRVVYYALDNTEAEMIDRFMSCLTGVDIEPTRLKSKYKSDLEQHIGTFWNENFILCAWPPKRHRVSDIKTSLDFLKITGLEEFDIEDGMPGVPGHVDAVITDSGDLFVPEMGASAKADRWLVLGDIFEDHVALAKEMSIPILTTTQGNRATDGSDNLKLSDVAESIGKFRPVGNAFGIVQSMPERAARQMRLQILKLRRPEGVGKFVRCYFDPYKQRVWEDPHQTHLLPMYAPDGTAIKPVLPSDQNGASLVGSGGLGSIANIAAGLRSNGASAQNGSESTEDPMAAFRQHSAAPEKVTQASPRRSVNPNVSA